MTVALRAPAEHGTLLDALVASFADAAKSPADIAQPAVILWPDAERRWQALVPRLREAFQYIYTLGAYAPETGTGPSIWLRCIVDRTLPEFSPPRDVTPVFYLPGVSRQTLRAGAECPADVQPLIELQFRGRVWHQPNGQEWSVDAFVASRHGLGLDIARDAQTREALHRTLALLADADLSALRDRRLHAADFDALAVDDPVRDLLRWLNDPDGTRRAVDDVRWQALSSRARAQFAFDPAIDPPLAAADRLIAGDHRWDPVWSRFCENPRIYPGVARLMRAADARISELALDAARRPRANDDAEEELRTALREVASLPHPDACTRVMELEARHAPRRQFVWAQLGESPLVTALEHLAHLASDAARPVAGNTVEAIATAYAEWGWSADAAAMEAMAAATHSADADAVNGAVRAVYLPWLDSSAHQLQRAMSEEKASIASALVPDRDVCVLFADGLRYDVGTRLRDALEARGLTTHLSHRIAAIPTATPTAKPAASPVADALAGRDDAADFTPFIRDTGQSCTAERLREVMTRRDVTVLAADEVRPPSGERGGWTECGEIDALGHKIGLRLSRQLSSEVDQIAERIAVLIEGGWVRVHVVTDHGWLLVPGGLPKIDIPKSVTSTRWARCALVQGDSHTDLPVLPWHWNPHVRIASPPGAGSFIAGHEYAHGGVSPQECVVPELIVQRRAASLAPAISDVTWTRLRCRVTTADTQQGSMVDIRLNWKDAKSSIVASARAVGSDGQVSMVVPDDRHEGIAAVVVLLDPQGAVVARRQTTVGGEG